MIFWTMLRKEWLELWRSSRLLIVAAVLLLMGLFSPLAAKLTPEMIRLLPNGDQLLPLIPPPTVNDAVAQYIKNISQFGVILALLMAMGMVAQEKERGTAALMLVKPLPRWAFLGAKLAALTLMFLASLLLAGLAAYYYTLLLFEPLDILAWLALNGLMLVLLMVYAAVTLFFSTLSRSQALAVGLGFGFLLLLAALGSIPGLGEYLPGQLMNWGTQLATSGGGASWASLWISLLLIVAAFVGALLIFRRQEL